MVATLQASAEAAAASSQGDEPAKKSRKGEKSDKSGGEKRLGNITGENKQVLGLVVKATLQQQQKVAALEGALFDTHLGEDTASDPVVLSMGEQTSLYAKEVQAKGKGHGYGPPHLWAYGGLISSLCKLGGKIGHSTSDHLKKHLEEYETMEVKEKCEIVRYCRLSSTYKSSDRRITICLAPCHPVRPYLNRALEELNWERKFGKAPKAFLERELQEWLNIFMDK